ncbi:MAG: dihydrofolate reductase, partial [Gemmatimonadota bacterium]|nr:dihydrofolate reductase [Gemmatimonadota bacterium]
MKISLLAALDNSRVIGFENRLPWHLPDDMKRFRETTTGHTVVMGRRTFESVGRPLPKRHNIVLSRQSGWTARGVEVASD